MGRIEKTVFVSYRRTDESWGLAIFQDLTQHGYDVFIDYDGIASGNFEAVILENIRARAHFLVLLTPTALERCSDPKDWMRLEIEAALDSQRNIVPLMLAGLDFGTPATASQLTGKLVALKKYNGLEIPKARFFSSEMERLRNKFLNVRVDTVLHPASDSAQRVAKEQKDKATMVLGETLHQRRLAVPQPRWTVGSFVGLLLIGLGLWYWHAAPPKPGPEPSPTHSINLSPPPVTLTPTQATNSPAPIIPAEANGAAQKNVGENTVNLLSPEQGGQLLAAPDESWRKLTSGKEDDYVHYRSGPEAEAVYAFRDKKPATFGKLEILIKGTDEFNPKEIEILAENDWPDGTFRPVTKCTFMNQLMMDARYQQCDFPETTARFVKIRLLSSFHFNDWANLPQIRLLGWSAR